MFNHLQGDSENGRGNFVLRLVTSECPATDVNPEVTKHYLKVWQTEWDGVDALLMNCTASNLTWVTVAAHISGVVML